MATQKTVSFATTLPITLVIASLFLTTAAVPATGRQVPSLDQIENNTSHISKELLSKVPSSSLHSSNLSRRSKRMVFDSSCKGIYDRELFIKLERLCEDCYNLYRKPRVATECRKNCFTDDTFKFCVKSLELGEEEYAVYANKLSENQL